MRLQNGSHGRTALSLNSRVFAQAESRGGEAQALTRRDAQPGANACPSSQSCQDMPQGRVLGFPTPRVGQEVGVCHASGLGILRKLCAVLGGKLLSPGGRTGAEGHARGQNMRLAQARGKGRVASRCLGAGKFRDAILFALTEYTKCARPPRRRTGQDERITDARCAPRGGVLSEWLRCGRPLKNGGLQH